MLRLSFFCHLKDTKSAWTNPYIYIYIYIDIYIHTARKEELFELFKTDRNSLNKITKLSKANNSKCFIENKKKTD